MDGQSPVTNHWRRTADPLAKFVLSLSVFHIEDIIFLKSKIKIQYNFCATIEQIKPVVDGNEISDYHEFFLAIQD